MVLTKSKADADKAHAALERGDAWKAVAKRYSIDDTSKAAGGKLPAQAKGTLDKELDEAVFSAKKGELVGPVKTQYGYYVFTVTDVTAAASRRSPRPRRRSSRRSPSQDQQKALDAFTTDFTKRWREKTECAEGYKTSDCTNGPKATPTHGRRRCRGSVAYAITYGRMPPREWDAASYDRMSDPQLAMARDVIDRLDLRGDERVLDAGLRHRPRHRAARRARPQRHGDRRRRQRGDGRAGARAARRPRRGVRVRPARARRSTQPVDAILSTATFHWIADHERLFARLHAALKPGGRLVGAVRRRRQRRQRAGRDRRRRPSRRSADWPGPWNFATPAETAGAPARPPASATSGRGCSRGRSSPTTRASTSRP